ncbi:uncharacterized protein [Neodiprion pinetum]|uniref:uncharacterized protein n=1 Tax=Neodiprion pinetum TaxID=441929 RepID=UPI00371768A2
MCFYTENIYYYSRYNPRWSVVVGGGRRWTRRRTRKTRRTRWTRRTRNSARHKSRWLSVVVGGGWRWLEVVGGGRDEGRGIREQDGRGGRRLVLGITRGGWRWSLEVVGGGRRWLQLIEEVDEEDEENEDFCTV